MKKQAVVIKEGTSQYTPNNEGKLGVEPMIVTKSGLKITYHNPNTPEELAKELGSLVAESMYNKIKNQNKPKLEEIEDLKDKEEKEN